MIAFIVTASLVIAGALAATAGGAYFFSGLRRAARRARRERREAERRIASARGVLTSRERALHATARRYMAAQARSRLDAVPLETLREQTDRRVKVAPLERAGYTSVGELVDKSRAELRAVKGVGPYSAHVLSRAVQAYAEAAAAIAPAPPSPGLTEPRAEELARDGLVYLEAFRAIGDAPDRMRDALRAVDERLQPELKHAGFVGWVRGPREPDRLEALAREVAALRASGPFEEGARAEAALGSSAVLGPEQVRAAFRRDYADTCALLERTFAELGGEWARLRTSKRGAAPAHEEIARRVEAFPLLTTGLRVILRRYQAFGARYLLELERTILGDEMGLGKTIQALAAMNHLARERDHCCALVVAPASILANWMHEIGLRTPLEAHLLHGEDFDETLAAWIGRGGVGVTSYSTLRGNVAAVTAGAKEIALLVADEAHYVKNPEAGRTKALVRVSDNARRVCFMSGTPLENHPEEFVALLETLAPARGRDLAEFLDRPGSVLGGPKRFHEELADVYLRRNQEDVLPELPERIDKEEWVDLGAEERDAYAVEVEQGNFMGMRRAVTEGAAKMERLADLLEEYRASGVKVILFSFFLDVLEEVTRRFPVCGAITGAVAPDVRFEVIRAFTEAEGHQLLVGQIQAAGTGLNLQAAGAVVLMEPQLKPTTEAQAIARAHRMGQTRRVVVHRLLARDCVDERLVEVLAEKQDLFERFARESLIKEASEEAVAATPARAIIDAERARLK